MATVKIPRFLLPRGPLSGDSFSKFVVTETITIRRQGLQRGYASGKAAASKPKMLDKPTRFNPPSHPAHLNKAPPRQYPGPPLPFGEQEAQKTRSYPHMMPRPGTWMHWFLTTRSIHVWITMVRLLPRLYYMAATLTVHELLGYPFLRRPFHIHRKFPAHHPLSGHATRGQKLFLSSHQVLFTDHRSLPVEYRTY